MTKSRQFLLKSDDNEDHKSCQKFIKVLGPKVNFKIFIKIKNILKIK